MLNIKKWWSMIEPTSGPHPAGEVLWAARDAEVQYSWLLPGDVTYCPTPSTGDSKAAVEGFASACRRAVRWVCATRGG